MTMRIIHGVARARQRAKRFTLFILQRPRARKSARRFIASMKHPRRRASARNGLAMFGTQPPRARERAKRSTIFMRQTIARASARNGLHCALFTGSRTRAPARETVYTIYSSTTSRAQARDTVYNIYASQNRARKRAKRFAIWTIRENTSAARRHGCK